LVDWERRRKLASYRKPPDSRVSLPRHTVEAIEKIVLPDWHEQDCPWCAEKELYRQSAPESGEPLPDANLWDRIETLTNSMHVGLAIGLFLQIPSLPPLEITDESIFVKAPATQATVFAGVAGAKQRLRTPSANNLALGPRRFPIATVLKWQEYLVDTFSDSILRASFLRAARHDELIYADQGEEAARVRRALDLIFSNVQTETDVTAEIILAAITGKFPGLDLDDPTLLARLTELEATILLRLQHGDQTGASSL